MNFKQFENKSVVKKGNKTVPEDLSGKSSLWKKGKQNMRLQYSCVFFNRYLEIDLWAMVNKYKFGIQLPEMILSYYATNVGQDVLLYFLFSLF